MVKPFCILLSVATGLLGAYAQIGAVPEAADTEQRRSVIFFAAGDDADFTTAELRIVYESLVSAIRRADPNLVILEHDTFDTPEDHERLYAAALREGAHSWLYVEVTGSMEDVGARASSYDILRDRGQAHLGDGAERAVPFRLVDRLYWQPLTESMYVWNDPVTRRVGVTVNAPPGSTIHGLTDEAVPVGPAGEVVIHVENPATYTARAERTEHFPAAETFYVGYDSVAIDLDPIPVSTWGVDLSLNGLQFLGARGTYYPVPARVFVRAGITSYAVGVYLISSRSETETPELFEFNPMTLLSAQAGGYLNAPERRIRPYGGAGAFLRVRHDGDKNGLDSVAPFGLSATIGVEYAPFLRVRLFLEYEPLVYLPGSVDDFIVVSFPQGYYEGRSVPGYIITDNAAIDMRNTAVGIRIFL